VARDLTQASNTWGPASIVSQGERFEFDSETHKAEARCVKLSKVVHLMASANVDAASRHPWLIGGISDASRTGRKPRRQCSNAEAKGQFRDNCPYRYGTAKQEVA